MSIPTTKEELKEACKNWKAGDDNAFANIVFAYIDLNIKEATKNAVGVNIQDIFNKIAGEFECSILIIKKWSAGEAKPRPKVQGWVVRSIEEKMSEPEVNNENR